MADRQEVSQPHSVLLIISAIRSLVEIGWKLRGEAIWNFHSPGSHVDETKYSVDMEINDSSTKFGMFYGRRRTDGRHMARDAVDIADTNQQS